MKDNTEELKTIYRQIEQLIWSDQDDKVIELLEMYCSGEYSFSIRRMVLNAIKPVSDQPKFEKYITILRKSLEDEIGRKIN